MANIYDTEIEIFGPLFSKEKNIFSLLKVNKKEVNQMVFFLKDKRKDFRIKWDEGKNYFEFINKSKLGEQRNVREEFSVRINKAQATSFLFILKSIGLYEGYGSRTRRIDFSYNNIIWSLKYGSGIGDYWEAEASQLLKRKLANSKKVLNYLNKCAYKMHLKVWSPQEFKLIRETRKKKRKVVSIEEFFRNVIS